MRFYLVDVKSIALPIFPESVDESKVERLADAILECGGLLKPLLLKAIGPEHYMLIEGSLEYYAAVKAREKNPREGEMVNAFIIDPDADAAIYKQLQILER